jgi:hypothetical protein
MRTRSPRDAPVAQSLAKFLISMLQVQQMSAHAFAHL